MSDSRELSIQAIIGRMIKTEHRATFTDCDAYGHVSSARYLEMAINHRMSAVTEQLGIDTLHAAQNLSFAMVNKEVHLDFRSAAKFDDYLVIESWVEKIKRLRMTIHVRISDKETGKVRCALTIMSVAIDLASELPCRLPDTFMPIEGVNPLILPWAPKHPKDV